MLRLNKDKIKEIIPHRDPMLLVDEIVINTDSSVKGSYYFTGEEWFFRGHYPENPIVPGVILCEIMAQTSCGLLLDNLKGKIPYLISIDNAKFRKAVKPKDTIVITSKLNHIKGPFYYVDSKAYMNEALSAESEFSFIVK